MRALILLLLTTNALASTWRYDVHERAPGVLDIDARIPGGVLTIVGGMAPFVRDVRVVDGEHQTPVAPSGDEWRVPRCRELCHVRWTFALAEAAKASGDIDFARDLGDAIESPPGSWLLRPDSVPERTLLHVTANAPRRFVIGMPRGREPDTYETPGFPFDVYSALGVLEVFTINEVEVALIRNNTSIDSARVRSWAANAAKSVVAYYGRFPVAHALVLVRASVGRGIRGGMAIGGGGASISIGVGERTTEDDFTYDWHLTHEMVHLTFPSVLRVHHWIEEGIATYVEPVARAQAGLYPATRLWGDLVDGLPKGEPEAGDQGLDRTHTWGRTYWGGALFCLAADVAIRRETKNKFGLQDALCAIMRDGGTIDSEWDLDRALATGDKATGTHVLASLYRDMATSPHPIDLDALFARLGIVSGADGIAFRDDALDASIRLAIEKR